jgi:hypothetical protein
MGSAWKFVVVVVCAGALMVLGAGNALAGEVKGPPGSLETAQEGGNPNKTGAYTNSNSACSASGLNDFDTLEGQNARITQTPSDAPPGAPGRGTCAGGTNPNRDPDKH